MPNPPTSAMVTEQLRSYASRGVFRDFSEQLLPRGRTEYRFSWLTSRPVHAVYDARTRVLKLIDLLPGIASRSAMDRALRDFIASRQSAKLPPHRRISRALVPTVKCTNRGGAISLSLTLNAKRTADATRQAVLLISEIFQSFLAGPHHEYMVEHFGISED
jgi:hypothetical protein